MNRSLFLMLVFAIPVLREAPARDSSAMKALCAEMAEEVPLCYAKPPEKALLGRAIVGDESSLHALFLKSMNPSLDGEAGELYTAELHFLLGKVGSARFLADLRREDPSVRQHATFYAAAADETGALGLTAEKFILGKTSSDLPRPAGPHLAGENSNLVILAFTRPVAKDVQSLSMTFEIFNKGKESYQLINERFGDLSGFDLSLVDPSGHPMARTPFYNHLNNEYPGLQMRGVSPNHGLALTIKLSDYLLISKPGRYTLKLDWTGTKYMDINAPVPARPDVSVEGTLLLRTAKDGIDVALFP